MSDLRTRRGRPLTVAEQVNAELGPPATATRLSYCPLCSTVTNHSSGRCEFQEWHEQPRAD